MKKLLQIFSIFLLAYTPLSQASTEAPRVTLHTSEGDIVLELNPDKAPQTVANFLRYVDSGFYTGLIFHRVIRDFMIQGGGFTEQMSKKPTEAPIQNEADNGLQNLIGTIAMARTRDPHSATAQFFINTKNNDFLNHTAKNAQGWGYTVFGKVISGLDVMNRINNVATTTRSGYRDVPQKPVLIQSAEKL